MKKKLLLLTALMGTLTALAVDYPYLTIELTDGTKASISVSSNVPLNFDGATLTIGSESFTLTNLSKMYFSTTSETTGIAEAQTISDDEVEAIYDLSGRKVVNGRLPKGVYIINGEKKAVK